MGNDYYIVSFSGGKDSTAMLLRLMELEQPINEVLFCDTYKEFPQMYEHIEKIKKVVESKGIKFTELRSEKSFDYYMFEHEPKRKNQNLIGLKGFSWAGNRARWCTSRLKQDVINRYIKDISKEYTVIQYIGLAADEQNRLARANNQNPNHKHPLADWNWTEQDALNYCYALGYDWGGLYNYFSRVSCWCCPLQPLEELRKLRKHFPELWEELKDMDSRTWRKFKPDYSVYELDKRFEFEEHWIESGKGSIRSRAFYKELKEELQRVTDNVAN